MGLQGQIEEWFEAGEIDLAVAILEGDPPRHCRTQPLLDLPLALLVPANSNLHTAEELWKQRHIKERLLSPPATDAISKYFERGLRRHAVEWNWRVDMNAIDLVESYVARGFGIGVTLVVPGCRYLPEVRALPLPGFPSVPIGLMWRKDPEPATVALMQAMEREAELMRQQQRHHASAA